MPSKCACYCLQKQIPYREEVYFCKYPPRHCFENSLKRRVRCGIITAV